MYVTLSGGGWSNAASFRLTGRDLDPDVVSRAIGVEPSCASRRGDTIGPESEQTHRKGGWSLDSNDVLSQSDDHLNEHLRWLLDQLEPRADQLRDLVAEEELEAEFWCVVDMEGANVDFELPATTIARVAALGAALRLDVYAPEDVEPDVIEIPQGGANPELSDTD